MNFKDLDPAFFKAYPDYDRHETVRHVQDSESGLEAYVALHDTALGPGLGGCRMYAYAAPEDAIRDVLRLARGMTYKNALAGLPFGGGKSVIIGDPRSQKSTALMTAMGKAVAGLQGRYITAEDSGTNEHDMAVIARETSYVVGLQPAGETHLGGDPSPMTAWGVFHAMKAAVERRYGSPHLEGLKVTIQGMGAVGYALARLLHKDGAELTVTDVRADVLTHAQGAMPGIAVVRPEEIFSVHANVFAPCALGAQINDDTLKQLKVDIICGAANNQLARSEHGRILADRKILYAPDYVVNAGGVIAVAYEYFHRNKLTPFGRPVTREAMVQHVEGIGDTLKRVLNISESRGVTTAEAADELAEDIFRKRARAGNA